MPFIIPFLLLLTAVLVCSLYRANYHPLAAVPGPRVATISGLWRNLHFLTGKWHEEVLSLHQRYGPVVRIAPNELSIVDHDICQKLYGRGAIGKKTAWYDVWVTDSKAPGMFATQNEKQHTFLRKRVGKAYSMTTILSSEPDIQDCVKDLVRSLRERADENQMIDMSFWTAALAYDVVGKLTLGAPLGMVKSATDVMGLAENLCQIFTTMSNLGHFPGQGTILNNRIVMTLMNWLGIPNPMVKFRTWSLERIKERIESQDKPDDMLTHFLGMSGQTNAPASVEDVLVEVTIAIGAGADTVASAMRSCLLYICSSPQIYRQVQNEVDSLEDAEMLFTTIRELPYLRAACQEAMRLLPPIVFPLPRQMTTDLEIQGYRIPAGTVLSISPGAQNRDIGVFGADASCFRPERWLNDNSLSQKVMTFGGDGPRNCIGQNLAWVEIYLFIAYIIRNFEIGLSDPALPWTVKSYWIAYQQRMAVKLTRRAS